MLKRNKLEAVLLKITDNEFNAVWMDTYGDVPTGERSDLVRDFVAEQYDEELDGCYQTCRILPKSRLKTQPTWRNRWLCPR